MAALLANETALAQNLQEGRRKANVCAPCHGVDGRGRLPDVPHLAGQPAANLERQLRAFRTGARRNEMMTIVVKYLTDEDVRDLAANYASIKIEIKAQ